MSRLEMEGALQRLKIKKMTLLTSAESKMDQIKDALALSSITPIDEIDIDRIYILCQELKDLRDVYLDTKKKIRSLERELGAE